MFLPSVAKRCSESEFSYDNISQNYFNELESDINQLNHLFKKIQSKYPIVTEFKISNYKSKFYKVYSVIHLNQ